MVKTRSKQTGNLLMIGWSSILLDTFSTYPQKKVGLEHLGSDISYLVWIWKVPLAAVLGVFRICGSTWALLTQLLSLKLACYPYLLDEPRKRRAAPWFLLSSFEGRVGFFVDFGKCLIFPGFLRVLLILDDETAFFQIDFGVGWKIAEKNRGKLWVSPI